MNGSMEGPRQMRLGRAVFGRGRVIGGGGGLHRHEGEARALRVADSVAGYDDEDDEDDDVDSAFEDDLRRGEAVSGDMGVPGLDDEPERPARRVAGRGGRRRGRAAPYSRGAARGRGRGASRASSGAGAGSGQQSSRRRAQLQQQQQPAAGAGAGVASAPVLADIEALIGLPQDDIQLNEEQGADSSTTAPTSAKDGKLDSRTSSGACAEHGHGSSIGASTQFTGISSGEPVCLPLNESEWGDSELFWGPHCEQDAYCFACERAQPGDQPQNVYLAKLKQIMSECGRIHLLTLCQLVQQYYNDNFRDYVPGKPNWTLRSIRNHMLRDDPSTTTRLRNAERILFEQIVQVARTSAMVFDPVTNSTYVTSNGINDTTRLARALVLVSRARGGRD